jgi:pyrroloquinoline quinone biosynthesis protein E
MSTAPLALIAELTHRCPLHCLYCSNPLELQKAASELKTDDWRRVFRQAAKMGCLHAHLTGGEPLARTDVNELVAAARSAGLYTNLITSGVGLSEKRLQELVAAGLEHIQLSFQDCGEEEADAVAGTRSHALKVKLARMIRSQKIAFTINIVVHRMNLDRLEAIIEFAEQLQPDRLEIANVQYYGWALRNRQFLLPTREQVERSQAAVEKARERVRGRMKIDYVAPDYYARYPKACMGGWGRRLILVDPSGRALPCHAAGVIPGLEFDNVREHALEWIWRESAAFKRFRGEAWMAEPCRSCDRRGEDFGGCRCQAFLLAGDANATDPVCSLAPTHAVVTRQLPQNGSHGTNLDARELLESHSERWAYRVNPR